MTLRIHGIPASRAIRPLWAATELGLSFDHVMTDYKGGGSRTPEFLAINPNGHIPALEDDTPAGRVVVWESMACALYVAKAHGKGDGSDLSCANLKEEGEALRWAFWSMTELEKDALTVLMHRMAMPEAERKADLAEAAEGRLRVPLRVLEGVLATQAGQGQEHLCAARFTIADLCVASVGMWIRPSSGLMTEFPLTAAWLKRCLDRPAHQAARKLGR
jgi:glutathione S-transferase